MSIRMGAEAFAAYRAIRGQVSAADVPRELARAHFVRVNHDGSELWRMPRSVAGQRLRLTVRDGEVVAVHSESASGATDRGGRAQRSAVRSAAHKARLASAGLPAGRPAGIMGSDDMAARKTADQPAKRLSGPSGRNKHPGRMLHQPEEAWSEQDAAARAEGVSWAEWIRDAAARKVRARKP